MDPFIIIIIITVWDKCSDATSCLLNLSATSNNPEEHNSIHKDGQIFPPPSETSVRKIAKKAGPLYSVVSYFWTYLLKAGLILP